MLDSETKRRIDTARQILVGKVPDPKSQVEQITIALIYKFMDDMDAESEEFGGKRKFFAKDFARYGWAKLMRSGLGGHETLNLYAEAIERMPENPGIPPLFRDIFKNAYLPYRDPETLRMFLKVIDEFTYDHSERLGDAFEYLLSVLGSQGDAGQFRTPRHIIDFMVAVVDPKKTETVLDPACGTAGFLISAYKHILKANVDKKGHSALTPDEKGRLAQNFTGYDISPDMVRLSLVNLYLHGFPAPHIYEYDTLTSQDRWNEYADVILANPPFMSPKGGIKPHNRFGVQSKRSEVLFVDYMAEHLTPNGRAAIIVPEGIIFQSQTAYKQLRKMLVENALVAVVSLPAGVFNPYAGVKTSILFLDKALAKRTDKIAFFKVDNDGFDLGAQRRPIDKNDLPAAADFCKAWLQSIRSGKPAPEEPNALVVEKAKIAKSGEYNLSGERYRESDDRQSAYPKFQLGDLLKLEFGTRITQKNDAGTLYPVYGGGGESFRTDSFTRENDVVISRFAMSSECVRKVAGKFYLLDSGFTFSIADSFKNMASKEFVAQVLLCSQNRIYGCARGHAQKNIDTDAFKALQIPLPPLSVQKEIVAEIEGYQKVIDGARAVLDHYRPHIPIRPEWPMVPIREVGSVESGYGFPLDYQGKTNEEIPFLKVSDMNLTGNEKNIVVWNNTVSRAVLKALKAKALPKGTVIFPKIGAAIATNKKRILTRESTYDNNVMGIVPNLHRMLPDFLHTYLLSFDLSRWASDSQPPSMRKTTVEAHEISLPTLAEQRTIVAEIEAEQALVNASRELITRMEKKIQAVLSRVWGDENASEGKA